MIVFIVAGQTRRDLVEAQLGKHGNAVECLLPVNGDVVAKRFERFPRKRVVDAFGLLQANHVRLALPQPIGEGVDPLVDRIDVPGCNAHFFP